MKDEDTWNQHIAQYVADMAAAVDTVGTDRQFQSTGLGEITVGGGVYGWKIDQSSEIRQLTEELANRTVTTREPVYKSRGVTTENNGFGYTYVEIDLSRQHLWPVSYTHLICIREMIQLGCDELYSEFTEKHRRFLGEFNQKIEILEEESRKDRCV